MPKRSAKNKKEADPLICKRVQYELAILFQRYPAKVISRLLRDMMIDYLSSNPEPVPYNLERTVAALWKLMRVLDKAADELTPWTIDEIFRIAKAGNYVNLEDDADEEEPN